MISRSLLARSAQKGFRRSYPARVLQSRGFAAATAANSGAFDTSDVSGLKVASRDSHGPTTKLAIVSRAGTRHQPLPGLTVGLEEFAFKNTQRRSALRITRESELLGGQLSAFHTREALVLEASFLRENLPYFAELLAEVVSMTKYTTHEFHEEVERVIPLKQAALRADVRALALDNAHAVAFHTGLGAPIYPSSATAHQKYLNEEYIASYADAAYAKSNMAVVADGASSPDLSKWVGQFFDQVPASSHSGQTLKSEPSKYHGGEQRIDHAGGNCMVIAFPGSDSHGSKPEIAVLASLLGGKPTVKWSTGFGFLSKASAGLPGFSASSSNLAYSDAGLLAIQLSGPAASVRKVAEEAFKALKSVANGSVGKDEVAKAIANAKFDVLEKTQLRAPSMLLAGSELVNNGKTLEVAAMVKGIESVNADKLTKAAKSLIDAKATVSTVGDLFVLPFAEEIGLRV